jgi:hypothetical protein
MITNFKEDFMKAENVQWRRILALKIIAFLLLGLALSGCADLSAIRKFSDISTEAENYKQISEDYINIPERIKYFEEGADHERLEKIRKARENQLKGILDLHEAVAQYMKSLGELADDKQVSYTGSLDALKDQVVALPAVKGLNVSATTVDAFSTLADLLTHAVADAYRRKKLQEFIGRANLEIITITSAQKDIIGKAYKQSLNNELILANEYYSNAILDLDIVPAEKKYIFANYKIPINEKVTYLGDLILEDKIVSEKKSAPTKKEAQVSSKDRIQPKTPEINTQKQVPVDSENELNPIKKAALVPLREQMQQKFLEIDNKKQAADAYLKVLDNIQKGHQELYDRRYDLKSETLLADMKLYSDEIQKLFLAIIALK